MKTSKEITKDTQCALKYFQEKLAFTLGPVDLKEKIANKEVKIIDVRKGEDYDKGHIPSAISIPKNDIKNHLSKLSKDDINIVYCYNQQCHLASKAAEILAENGYPVMELEGGMNSWKEDYDFEIES